MFSLPAKRRADILWNSGSSSHLYIRRNVSRPDLSLLHGLGLRSRSDNVPWDRHNTLWANIAWGMLYLLSSALILWANSFVLISSTSSAEDEAEVDWEMLMSLFELWPTLEPLPCLLLPNEVAFALIECDCCTQFWKDKTHKQKLIIIVLLLLLTLSTILKLGIIIVSYVVRITK